MPEAGVDKNWANFQNTLRCLQIRIEDFQKMREAEVRIKIAGPALGLIRMRIKVHQPRFEPKRLPQTYTRYIA